MGSEISSRRIGIYGGTFDPVHAAHVSVVKSFLNSGEADEIWIMPALQSPFKPDGTSTHYHHRVKMAELAFRGIPGIRICETEKNLPKPSYTLQTLEALEAEFPGHIFLICIGGDNLSSFSKWYRYREILQKAKLLVAARPGFQPENADTEVLNRVIFADHEPVECSSSALRESLSRGEHPDEIHPDVMAYIREHRLYSF